MRSTVFHPVFSPCSSPNHRICSVVATRRIRHRKPPCQTIALLNQILRPFVPSKRSPVDDARAELLEAIRGGSTDLQQVSSIVDILLESNLPFREQLLGGGPWQVVYSRGPLLWQGFTLAGNALSKRRIGRSRNKASQEYNPADRSVINRGEIFGQGVCVAASGSYEPVGETDRMPVLVRAEIEGGQLRAFGKVLPLPIRGSGFVRVAYLDDCIRVLQDRRGGVAVQMREDRLRQIIGDSG